MIYKSVLAIYKRRKWIELGFDFHFKLCCMVFMCLHFSFEVMLKKEEKKVDHFSMHVLFMKFFNALCDLFVNCSGISFESVCVLFILKVKIHIQKNK